MSDVIWQDVGGTSAGYRQEIGRMSAGNRQARRQDIGRHVGRQAGRYFGANCCQKLKHSSNQGLARCWPSAGRAPGRAEGAKALNLLSAVSEDLELSVGEFNTAGCRQEIGRQVGRKSDTHFEAK